MKESSILLLPIDVSGSPPPELPASGGLVQDVCASTAAFYEVVGFHPPWIGYLALVGSEIVGTCAFKSSPRLGRVEIAYFTFPEYERRGFATEMARTLVRVAHTTDPEITITAQTLPERNASCAILTKLGFTMVGSITDTKVGEIWEWELSPGAIERV